MTATPTGQPYGSANDLPSVVEMRQLLAGGKVLTFFVARDQRTQLGQLERDLDELVSTVDRFYGVFGPRHWIFTGNLPVPDVKAIIDAGTPADVAELRLIEVIGGLVRSEWWRSMLFGHPAMRARQRLVERAREHYLAEQWDSSALMLITAMDGFVNDVEPAARRGLHAREASEMVAWDSVVGHHMGLTAVMPVFLKTFKRRHDDEVFELHRHGIVHGTVVNYNNAVVATKAWNMMAAVVDWASASEKAAAPKEAPPSIRSTISLLADHGRRARYRDSFKPHTVIPEDDEFADLSLIAAVTNFLDGWANGRWAEVVEHLPPVVFPTTSTRGQRAAAARRTYESVPLKAFVIEAAEFPQAHVGVVTGTATLDGRIEPFSIRWLYQSPSGDLAMPGEEGARWVIAVYPPHTFFEQNEPAP